MPPITGKGMGIVEEEVMATPGTTASERADRGVAGAAKAVAADISALVRAEIDLAKAELAAGLKAKAVGIGLLLGTAVLAWLGIQALLVAAGVALALVVPGWAAALIVAGTLLLIGAILALVAVRSLKKPVGIDAAKQQVTEDVEWMKSRLNVPQTSEQIREDVAWTRANLTRR